MYKKRRIGMLKRVLALVLSVVVLVAFTSCSSGDKKDKVYRVGILSGLDYLSDVAVGFKDEMTNLGYIDGENITYDLQKTNSNLEEFNKIAKKFVEDKVDLVFCFPTEAALALKEATKGTDIPVIFSVTNVEGTDIVKSVREPGGNLTGVRYPGPDLALKRFEVLRQIVPTAKRLLVPYSSDYPVCYPQLEQLRPVAKQAGITLVEAPFKTPQELNDYFKKIDVEGDVGFDAILSIAEIFSVTPETFLTMIKFANKHKTPMGGAYMELEGYSSIFGVNVDSKVTGKKSAGVADKVLKGEKAATVPVVSDDSFMQLNYKETQRLGLTVPQELLSEATQVIK